MVVSSYDLDCVTRAEKASAHFETFQNRMMHIITDRKLIDKMKIITLRNGTNLLSSSITTAANP